VQTSTGDVQRVEAQVQERIQRRVADDPDVTAAPAIPARRSAARNEFFAPERSHAVAAVASCYPNFYAIDEHAENSLTRSMNAAGNFNFEI